MTVSELVRQACNLNGASSCMLSVRLLCVHSHDMLVGSFGGNQTGIEASALLVAALVRTGNYEYVVRRWTRAAVQCVSHTVAVTHVGIP